ncbi:hypothetical protein P154DRAFT_577449 [Amniculicola lignicola CBS 123094]|uniref:protein-ribulosamine 3-kinase n=1 Tax=Amniculicola lignicola CBS 123094 TaxID=1392246 RepID=A0A6A5WBL0_9PLEO|nr:hypothetical protein P154DRAFT_577449 [Amniculicola lignicola CBS 123094]
MPELIPKPVGYGKYKEANLLTYFYMSEFVDMDVTTVPDPAEFTAKLAFLHKNRVSPIGNWADFYRNLFLGVCRLDLETNGSWIELERAIDLVVNKIIPRLLGVLQQDGQSIKPCIIHGDLWEGNMGINKETGESLLFDASSFFAQNEMELGHWRCKFSSVFRAKKQARHYMKHYPAADPAEEFDDQNRLYSIKGAINYSTGHPGSGLKKTAYNSMCYLCEKYAPIDGIDKYYPQIDPTIPGVCIAPHLAEGLT